MLLIFRSAILGRGKLAQMTSGYFPTWRTTHSFPGPLHFSRWRSSQISHPGTVVDVKIPTYVRFTKSNSRGLPAPPILGQTIDRCINILLFRRPSCCRLRCYVRLYFVRSIQFNQLYVNTVSGSANWFSDIPCNNQSFEGNWTFY